MHEAKWWWQAFWYVQVAEYAGVFQVGTKLHNSVLLAVFKYAGRLQKLFDKHFGSFDTFRTEFANAGNTAFGSGWAWLVQDESKALKVYKTIGADNPIPRNHVRDCVEQWNTCSTRF